MRTPFTFPVPAASINHYHHQWPYCKKNIQPLFYRKKPRQWACPYDEISKDVSVLRPGFPCQNALKRGISSHNLPSKLLPALFLFTPPHCLKKKGTRAFTQSSRIERTHASFIGRAPRPGLASYYYPVDSGEVKRRGRSQEGAPWIEISLQLPSFVNHPPCGCTPEFLRLRPSIYSASRRLLCSTAEAFRTSL